MTSVSAALLICVVALYPLAASAQSHAAPALTPAPNGPYRIAGNRILDRQNRPYLIRGTQLAALSPGRADEKGSAAAFGPLSPTTLITIRQRLNMNAVRLPVSASEYAVSPDYRLRVEKLVHLANELELLVILETSGPRQVDEPRDSEMFWTQAAARFRNNPNIFFAPLSVRLAAAIRRSGAHQPVIVAGPEKAPPEERDLIYQVTPNHWQQPGLAAAAVPVLVNGLDPELDLPSESCAAFPGDPAEATALVEASLAYFDAQGISWTLSSFTAGKLITDYRYFNGTKLDAGWTCGKPADVPAGLGMVLLSHLWATKPLSLFTVSESRGGLAIARGGISTVYGPILADQEMEAHGSSLPTSLGNVSVRITDSHGVVRLAPLFHTGAGWAFISFVIPDECAAGPAEVAVVRTDGSIARSTVPIADLAPGIFTVPPDGRSAAVGQVTQHVAGKPDKSFPTWECGKNGCRTVPISLSAGVSTTVRLEGTGFRYAGGHPDIQVTVHGIRVPVLSIGRSTEPGNDQLTIRLPDSLAGAGETDLYFTVAGVLSNVVRINCGSGGDAPGDALHIPRGFPQPVIPADNPLTAEKVRLGRYLFYDKRMSVNGTASCATCHRQELAFTDGRGQGKGATGELHPRGAMTLVNVAWNRTFNWGDSSVHSLEEQALKPMMSTNPVELGFSAIEGRFLEAARTDPVYRVSFPAAFPEDPEPWTTANVARALASFERTIVSRGSPWDRFHFEGDESAISDAAKRGEFLFFLDGGPSCFRCHGGFNFSDSIVSEGGSASPAPFHNTGLYNMAGEFPYPPGGRGLYESSMRAEDVGRFKAPTLRNIGLTAPYMHDGSAATLGDVLDHYASGGRTISTGILTGVGHDNPLKDKLIHGFNLTAGNKADLIAFLESLTDQSLLREPELSDPWPGG
jgi:cytochrome c peroxidase